MLQEKISEIQYKEVYQYDRYTGNFLNRFESTIDAESKLNIPNANISSVCLKKMKTIHDYIFRYSKDGYVYGESLPKDEVVYANQNDCFVKVAKYNLLGELLEVYNSIELAAESVGAKVSQIKDCCRGKSKTFHGYTWKYKNA